MENISVCKIKAKVFMTICIILYLLAAGTMFTLLLLPEWVEVDSEKVAFKGSLRKITDGMESGRSYSSVADEWCKEKETISDLESYYYYNAGCEIFSNLAISANIVLTFQIVGILLILLLVLFSALSVKKVGVLYHIFFLSLISFSMQLLGFLVYIFLSDIVFDEECEVWYVHSDPGELCARQGTYLYLMLVLYLGLLLGLQGIYNIKHYRARKALRRYSNAKITPKSVIDSIDEDERSPNIGEENPRTPNLREIVSGANEESEGPI